MAVIEIDENSKKFPKHEKEDFYSYKGISFKASLVKLKPQSLKIKDFLSIIEEMNKKGYALNKDSIKVATRVYEKNKGVFYESFLDNYEEVGNINCYGVLLNQTTIDKITQLQNELTEKFQSKFRGRAPRIVHAMAIAACLYDIPVDDIVDNFNIASVRLAMQHLSPVETIILLIGAKDITSVGIFDSDVAKYAVKCYCYALKGKGEHYKATGDWIASHPQTNPKLLKKIAKKVSELSIDEKTTVESIKVQLGNLSSESEVAKIEKAYKKAGFKFRNCVFDLKFTDVTYDRYRMEILRPGDTRMVYLGDFTNCCQKLYDVGESAMMHGLLNPKAGFWCMTDERTGRVVAQAEIWEKENDPNTLVFDNIEFANDAEIGLYRKAIGCWLTNSPYTNVYMGCGYNGMFQNGHFRQIGAITPWVTPYEIYVISHEQESEAPVFKTEQEAVQALEDGRVTYYDYVYCDSEREAVVMKENGIVEPYFVLDNLPETAIEENENLEEDCEEDYEQ